MNEKFNLSQIDVKILTLLSQEGISSEQAMAKKLRIKPSTLNYKLRQFERKKIISSYKIRINPHKTGLEAMAWVFFRLHRQDINMEEDLLEQLLGFPQVYAALNITGEFDIAVKIMAKNITEIIGLTIAMEKRFKDIIRSSNTYFVSKSFKRHQVVLTDEHQGTTKLSKLDLKLIDAFRSNPKISLQEVTRQLKVHRNTASQRWQRLWKEKVILKKSVRVNPLYFEDIGIAFRAVMLFDVKAGEAENLGKRLALLPEVHELTMITSFHDLLAVVRTRDLDSFYQFFRKIYTNPKINNLLNNTNSSVILKGRTRSPEISLD